MSTNKTENYHLHAWEAGDDFLRSEFNENFADIDGFLAEMPTNKKLRIVTGSYTGSSGASQIINLGGRPKTVQILSKDGELVALLFSSLPGKDCSVTNTGFSVSGVLNVQSSSDYPYNGAEINPYRYIALCWE